MIYTPDTWYYDAETLWADRVWLHKHYLDEIKHKGVKLIIKYKDHVVEIPATEIDQKFDWCKPTKHVDNGEPVGHCGMIWPYL